MTIKDIAKACGVSVSTVSRVLNNRPDVSEPVRRKVLDVVEANGYIKVSENGPYQGSSPSGKVTVGGSSSVTPVMEKLAEAYEQVNENVTVEV